MWINSRGNEECSISERVDWLQQEISLHIKVIAKTVKQTTKCHALQVCVVVENV